jgi:uroporphyrinogen decarboxylase
MTTGPSLAPAYSFLRACRGEPIEQTPIWIMRQAGRYLPEYRALREKHSFTECCRVPELCAEVTAQPIDRFGFDAAILFSDILIPLLAMGIPLDFDPGPKLGRLISSKEDVLALRWAGAEEGLPHVKPVIRAVRERLAGRVPLIGFAGAPFTVAAYLIEAGGSRDLVKTRSFLARDPEAFLSLLEFLATATTDYLKAQIAAGADAVMLFDTQAGWLPPHLFGGLAATWAERVFAGLPKGTPTIYFALAPSTGQLESLRHVRADVFGVDYRVPLRHARAVLGNDRGVQGNLDPAVLLGPPANIVTQAEAVLRENGGRPGHIFNLGHGIFPDTPLDNVALLVDTVKRFRAAPSGATS